MTNYQQNIGCKISNVNLSNSRLLFEARFPNTHISSLVSIDTTINSVPSWQHHFSSSIDNRGYTFDNQHLYVFDFDGNRDVYNINSGAKLIDNQNTFLTNIPFWGTILPNSSNGETFYYYHQDTIKIYSSTQNRIVKKILDVNTTSLKLLGDTIVFYNKTIKNQISSKAIAALVNLKNNSIIKTYDFINVFNQFQISESILENDSIACLRGSFSFPNAPNLYYDFIRINLNTNQILFKIKNIDYYEKVSTWKNLIIVRGDKIVKILDTNGNLLHKFEVVASGIQCTISDQYLVFTIGWTFSYDNTNLPDFKVLFYDLDKLGIYKPSNNVFNHSFDHITPQNNFKFFKSGNDTLLVYNYQQVNKDRIILKNLSNSLVSDSTLFETVAFEYGGIYTYKSKIILAILTDLPNSNITNQKMTFHIYDFSKSILRKEAFFYEYSLNPLTFRQEEIGIKAAISNNGLTFINNSFISGSFSKIFQLNFSEPLEETIIVSTNSGNWENPLIWDCNCVPNQFDNVLIVSPHRIENINSQKVKRIEIQKGAVVNIKPNFEAKQQ